MSSLRSSFLRNNSVGTTFQCKRRQHIWMTTPRTKSTGWSNWVLLRKLKYFTCCSKDLYLFIVWHLSNSIWNTSISGVKSSWTTMYCKKPCKAPSLDIIAPFLFLTFPSLYHVTKVIGRGKLAISHDISIREPSFTCSSPTPRRVTEGSARMRDWYLQARVHRYGGKYVG